jgi:hypothetical protein
LQRADQALALVVSHRFARVRERDPEPSPELGGGVFRARSRAVAQRPGRAGRDEGVEIRCSDPHATSADSHGGQLSAVNPVANRLRVDLQ